MKFYQLLFAICMLAAPLAAEMIGDVEYHLPEAAQNWKVYNELKNPKSSTVIYAPQSTAQQPIQEYFSVHSNNLPSALSDAAASIQNALSLQHPGAEVQMKTVQQDGISLLVEWSIEEKGREKIHGWYRLFGSQEGTVMLGYQTENIAGVDMARKTWIPALESAVKK